MTGGIEVELTINVGRVADSVRAGVAQVVAATAVNVAGDAQQRIQEPHGSGRIYQRGKVSHQASAPGEAPATDTGALVNSILTDISHVSEDLSAEVIVGEGKIGAALEFGTIDGKIAPRPFLTPAAEAQRDPFVRALASAMAHGSAG